MINEKFKRLNENHINQSWQPTPADYAEIAPEEESLNFRINYARLLDNKVCLVTGASYGMGYKIAEVYAQHGAILIITARNAEKLEAAADEIRKNVPDANVTTYPADVMDEQVTKQLFAWIMEKSGRIDTIVNNVGAGDPYLPDTFDESALNHFIDLNLKAPMRYCEEALKIMLEQNYGNIVNVSSINGTRPLCGAVYSAAKGGLNTWTKSMAIRCVGTGVHCNVLGPGFTVTPLSLKQESGKTDLQTSEATHAPDFLPILHTKSTRNVPTFQVDQAHLALFLGSDLSRCITGQIINCDNGQYL